MECSKCHKYFDINSFSLKNKKQKIYYQHCNICREKNNEYLEFYKIKAKENYELLKITNYIKCECGAEYVAFRDHHIYRHYNSKRHLEYMKKKIENKSKNKCI